MRTIVFVLLLLLLPLAYAGPLSVIHAKPSLVYEYGTPVSRESGELSTHRIEYQHPFYQFDNFSLDVTGSVGTVSATAAESATFGSGLGLRYMPAYAWQIRMFGGISYLEEYRLQARTGEFEDFGGNLQFNYNFEVNWLVPIAQVVAGYRFQHMSNAGIYDANPRLNTHNLTLAWRF